MRRAFHTVQVVVVLAVLGTATTMGATPAAAAMTAVDATLVLPLSAGAPPDFGVMYSGVSVDPGLGLGTASVGKNTLIGGCFPTRYLVTVTAPDGSSISANHGPSCATPIFSAPFLLTLPVTVVGGTGRFAGASGSGTLQFTEIVTPITSAAIASLRLQVST